MGTIHLDACSSPSHPIFTLYRKYAGIVSIDLNSLQLFFCSCFTPVNSTFHVTPHNTLFYACYIEEYILRAIRVGLLFSFLHFIIPKSANQGSVTDNHIAIVMKLGDYMRQEFQVGIFQTQPFKQDWLLNPGLATYLYSSCILSKHSSYRAAHDIG